jgi:hypothetical protein
LNREPLINLCKIAQSGPSNRVELLIIESPRVDLGIEDLEFAQVFDLEIGIAEVPRVFHFCQLLFDEVAPFCQQRAERFRKLDCVVGPTHLKFYVASRAFEFQGFDVDTQFRQVLRD